MKKNIKINAYLLNILPLFLLTAALSGCLSSPKSADKTTHVAARRSADNSTAQAPRRLITDYSGMKQNNRVSWLWVRPGFKLNTCNQIKIHPLKNYSGTQYRRAEKKLGHAVKEIFGPVQNTGGRFDAGVTVAITGMTREPGIIKRWFPTIVDHPSVEVEIIIFEEASGTILLKLCHYRKEDEDFRKALRDLIADLKGFFAEQA